jgi:tetratricopeptide (TPR) repeat protein
MADRLKHFPSETAAMRILTTSSGSRLDQSFTIGLGVVLLFAGVEILLASFHYLGRHRPTRTATSAPSTVPSTVLIPAPSAPPLTLASPAPAVTASPASVLAEPDRLLQDAVVLREKGDTTNALAKLQEAVQRDPKNASVLAEMAATYESMGLIDRSNETWRKIQELGPAAGDLFEKADRRLKIGVAPAGSATPSMAASTSLATGSSRPEAGVTQEGGTFEISEVKVTESPDPDADTNLMLRIGVKKRTNAATDHTRVKIQVYFYDTVDDKDVKLTDADVSYEWLTATHDWTETNPEVLAVTYVRTKNRVVSAEAQLSAAAAAVVPGKKVKPVKAKEPSGAEGSSTEAGRRRYLGYIVRVYYYDQLQAVRADPPKLLNLFPTPSTAPSP